MSQKKDTELDVIGYWSEVKLKILEEYSAAYSTILSAQSTIKHVAYIDGFAGAGEHVSEVTGKSVEGSPAIALKQNFSHYHFIDLDKTRTRQLEELVNPNWSVMETAGKMRSIEIFHNFMIMDGNMNVFCESPDKVSEAQAKRMTDFWGDDSWRKECYAPQGGLFNNIIEKETNEKSLRRIGSD